MAKEISVAKGLSELKVLDARIYRVLNEAKFGSIQVKDKFSNGFKNREEVEKEAKSSLDSVVALIENRNAIKSAIVVSNATTKVEVAGNAMTVAEAIERKNSIEYEKTLLASLRNQYSKLLREEEKINSRVKERLDEHLQVFLGKDGKVDEKTVEAISKTFRSDNEATIIDPVNLKQKIEKLAQEIEDFENNVDFVLNESNVITKITIE